MLGNRMDGGAAAGIVKVTALLHTPPWRTRATPVTEPELGVATIWVSLQVRIWASELPRMTAPLPCVAPKTAAYDRYGGASCPRSRGESPNLETGNSELERIAPGPVLEDLCFSCP